jgi:hypothetical protein
MAAASSGEYDDFYKALQIDWRTHCPENRFLLAFGGTGAVPSQR